jgi:protein-ribulosamine 3-kinase
MRDDNLRKNYMLDNNTQNFIGGLLCSALKQEIFSIQFETVGGGSINETFQIFVNKTETVFCKINTIPRFPSLFKKEKSGLELLAKQKLIRTPCIIACDEFDNKQILLLEWVEHGLRTEAFWKKFGGQLAALHHVTSSDGNGNSKFGLNEDNFMGALPQRNSPSQNWVDFFICQRLEPQARLAVDNHLIDAVSSTRFSNLYKKLPEIFPHEESSLLHGDLWSGNFLCDEFSEPVLIDPAVYFGHRSMDLAMTTLFGGFDKAFYNSYDYHFPFPSNYREQWEICNLYPLLIHLNLFGKSYLGDILATVKKF